MSDVTPPDFAALLDPSALPRGPAPEHLERTIARWNGYLTNGTFALSVARDAPIGASDEAFNFWTSPWPYWEMHSHAPGVWNTLRDSGLVIFKVRSDSFVTINFFFEDNDGGLVMRPNYTLSETLTKFCS